ncbi:MAG: protein phosphatase 2C domain-containing protein [Planctomycetota bacterium]|nr:protein phosphatase 2C domain-containing protein [Planctomycetota bacterium]
MGNSPLSDIDYSEMSDIGMRRFNNQDSFVSLVAKTEDRYATHGHLFVVADGMGAHAAGELASRIATDQISRSYSRVPAASQESLKLAFDEANREIHSKGQSNPEFHNMGTTASGLAITPHGAFVAHVGDSRVYRLRGFQLDQLTFDHSLVWEIEANPELKLDSWSGPIPKNVITRSLGPNAQVEIDVEGPFPVEQGDRFILCSDGLTGVVDDEEVGTIVGCLNTHHAAQVLVDLANLRGGPDNITVTVVEVKKNRSKDSPGVAEQTPSTARAGASPSFSMSTAAAFFSAVLLGFAGLVMQWPFLTLSGILVTAGIGMACVARGKSSGELKVEPIAKSSRGKSPYRSYNAHPTTDLYQRLGDTVKALRKAAAEQNWLMEWNAVNEHQARGEEHVSEGHANRAIESQAHAIIEAMKQLRDQQNRAANDTAVDL